MSRLHPLACLLLCVAAALVRLSHGFYVPGVAPVEFREGEEVEIKVQILTCLFPAVAVGMVLHLA